MKTINLALMLVALVAMTFVLAGCPKKSKMMGYGAQSVSYSQIG